MSFIVGVIAGTDLFSDQTPVKPMEPAPVTVPQNREHKAVYFFRQMLVRVEDILINPVDGLPAPDGILRTVAKLDPAIMQLTISLNVDYSEPVDRFAECGHKEAICYGHRPCCVSLYVVKVERIDCAMLLSHVMGYNDSRRVLGVLSELNADTNSSEITELLAWIKQFMAARFLNEIKSQPENYIEGVTRVVV